jgi:hypothetical protein
LLGPTIALFLVHASIHLSLLLLDSGVRFCKDGREQIRKFLTREQDQNLWHRGDGSFSARKAQSHLPNAFLCN